MSTTSPLRDRLRAALVDARRSRGMGTVSAVRSALSALENAEAVPIETLPAAGAVESARLGVGSADVSRRVLGEHDERVLLDAEIADLRAAATAYTDAGYLERATDATRAADVLDALT